MFGSAILDVALGLVFVFLLLSLVCSALNELLETGLKKRASDLERGIKELIGDPNNETGFVAQIYNHGLVNGLFRGKYGQADAKLPSYIPARNFAIALIQIYEQRKNASAAPEQDPALPLAVKIPPNIVSALNAFENTAKGDLNKMREHVEHWYNSSMDRVSGWYERRTQLVILCVGIVLSGALNVDCLEIARRLSTDPTLRQGVVSLAAANVKSQPASTQNQPIDQIKANIKALDTLALPIGWEDVDQRFSAWLLRILGWLLTGVAVSLGAPFWFDVLNKIIVVRSTVKPHEKSREEGSKDAAQ
jgi:hypothetical protein